MSSISQMERSSSQIRMLATRALPSQCWSHAARSHSSGGLRQRLYLHGFYLDPASVFRGDAPQTQNKRAPLALLRPGPHFTFVRLHNLVNNGQPQTGAALKLRLKRFEDLLDHLRPHAGAGVGERELPIRAWAFNANRQVAAVLHGPPRFPA